MRRLILVSVLALASVTAQAGQQKGLLLASNDERIESLTPEEPQAPAKSEAPVRSEATRPVKEIPRPVQQPSRPVKQASKPANKVHVKGYQNEEAAARRIAASYGFSW
jgi:hypothetical protein